MVLTGRSADELPSPFIDVVATEVTDREVTE